MKTLADLMQTCAALVMAVLVAMPTVSAKHSASKDKGHGGHDPLANLRDDKHGIKMGTPSPFCDDGKNYTWIDWDPLSTSEIECHLKEGVKLRYNHGPLFKKDDNPDPPMHICFPDEIHYDTDLPLSGNHRPLWPRFGEYEYLPPQRWVHSLEHGAIVFLYHPCTDESLVTHQVRNLLKGCLWKYIISPYRLIPQHMPFALLAYGHAVLFSAQDSGVKMMLMFEMLKNFIQVNALKASETDVLSDGQYSEGLLEPAGHADIKDKVTCASL